MSSGTDHVSPEHLRADRDAGWVHGVTAPGDPARFVCTPCWSKARCQEVSDAEPRTTDAQMTAAYSRSSVPARWGGRKGSALEPGGGARHRGSTIWYPPSGRWR